MDLLSLRTFQTVVEEGGILSASRKLNTVQSNVTTRIKRLETELGAKLFVRKGRGLELAPSGKVLLGYVRQLLQVESQACIAVRQVNALPGELRVGSMETFAALRLPLVLKMLQQAHQGLMLHVEANTSAALVEQVLDYKLDCAFVGGPVDHPDLISQEVLTEELVLVRAKHQVNENLPLILFREGCAYRARALNWQSQCGLPADNIMELGTLDGILGCVAVGLGCTLMPAQVVEDSRYAKELEVEKLEPGLAMVPTVMIRHRQVASLKTLDTLTNLINTGIWSTKTKDQKP